jgi:hypothetical protein
MDIERSLGFEPVDRELEKLGYDIESRILGTGRLRFLEVKGRITGAAILTVTRNEILYSPKRVRRLHPRHRGVPARGSASRSLLQKALPAVTRFRRDERRTRTSVSLWPEEAFHYEICPEKRMAARREPDSLSAMINRGVWNPVLTARQISPCLLTQGCNQ